MLILSIEIFDAMQWQGGKYANLNIIRFQEVRSIKNS